MRKSLGLLILATAGIYMYWFHRLLLTPLVIGWFQYPFSTWPRVQANWPLFVVGAGSLLVFGLVVHRVGSRATASWVAPDGNTAWTWRSTFFVTSVALMLFAAGVVSIGAAHQVAWIASNQSDWYENRHAWKVTANKAPLGPMEEKEVVIAGRVEEVQTRLDLQVFFEVLDAYHIKNHHWPTGVTVDHQGKLTDTFEPVLYYFDMAAYRSGHAWNSNEDVYPFAANRHVFGVNSFESRSSVTDGLESTLGVGEAISERPSTSSSPVAALRDPQDGINRVPWGFGGPTWQGGAQFLMLSGSVRTISEKTDLQVLKALSTPHGYDDPGNGW